ncbi:MAG: TA system VapC family ribonuclease toxin [Acidimicrobiales bacterium]
MGDDPPAAQLIDANLVLWAHHEQFAQHDDARRWWAETLASDASIGVPWPTILAFVRISTHPRAFARPLDVSTAYAVVEEWLARPNVFVPVPTDRHATLYGTMLRTGRAAGNHSTDAHLAALAVEWGLEVMSADRDFARYPGLRWHDPTSSW